MIGAVVVEVEVEVEGGGFEPESAVL